MVYYNWTTGLRSLRAVLFGHSFVAEDQPSTVPTIKTIQGLGRTPCQFFTNRQVKADLLKMDPLVAAAFHNLNCSRLCRLPEELLLSIMIILDLPDVQCLRRSTRLFLRLYSSSEFNRFHVTSGATLGRPFRPWRYPLPSTLPPARDFEGYCQSCPEIRTDRTWNDKMSQLTKQYLHCSGCERDHPAYLFSMAQRNGLPSNRVCIGRQGTVRYCHHNVVEWRKVAILSRWLCELQLDDVKTLPRVVIDECEEHSHGPKHHSPSSLQLFPGGIKPTVELRGDERNGVTMFIQWSGHLLLPSPEELGQDNGITPRLMHKLLRSLRQDGAEWIVPELPLGRLIEMNCFDPNLCRCLHYAGIEQLPQKWQLSTQEMVDERRASQPPPCRFHREYGLRPLQALQKDHDTGSIQGEEEKWGCHRAIVRTLGDSVNDSATFEVTINPCAGGSDRCLRVQYSHSVNIIPKSQSESVNTFKPLPITAAWIQALDPSSYGLWTDESTRRLLWCLDRGCKNYPGYLRRFPGPSAEINRACEGDC